MTSARRILASILACALGLASWAEDAGLAQGLQQIREGDFEAAVVTLDEAARRLEGQPGQQKDAAQARLHLGVARVALTQVDAALDDFKAALRHDPTLRVGEDRFSPKVVRVFETARQELAATEASNRPPAKKGSSKTVLVVVGAAAAAGIGIAAASGGSSPPSTSPGAASFSNARFEGGVILCPNGSADAPLPFTLLVDAANPTAAAVSIASTSVLMRIVESPEVPSEVGQSVTLEGSPLPSSVASHANVTLRIGAALLCTNAAGGVSRYNDWTALVTLQTSAGSFNLGTSDRLRVNLP